MTPRQPTWLVTALMALASFLGVFALSSVIATMDWTRTVAIVVLITAVAVAATRVWSRSKWLPTLVGLVTAVVIMVPTFAVDEDGSRRALPTPSAVMDLWAAIVLGVNEAATSPAPADATRGLVALITAFIVALFLVAEHLAASWRGVGSAGVVLILPWMPAIFLQYRVPLWALLAAAFCWLAAMGAARSAAAAGSRAAPMGPAVLASAAGIGVALLVVPSALGGTGWGAIPRFDTPRSLDTATRLNLELDLRNSLTVDSAQDVLRYTSSARKAGVFRLYTLTDFDGTSWARESTPQGDVPSSESPLWPEQVPDWDNAALTTLSVQITSMAERNLPLPAAPREIDVPQQWRYSPTMDEVTTSEGSTRELAYTINVDDSFFSAEQLRNAPPLEAGDAATQPQYTAIPPAVNDDRIRSLTDEVTADTTSQYDAAVAIQDYLRDPATFTYDTSVTPGGGDAVSDFLDSQTGYCVQFATTMVMMARSMNIPARLGLGYLGGHLVDPRTFEVRGGDAHVWPELYFSGIGWVRFEPTPAAQTGAPPEYADIYANQVPVVDDDTFRPPGATTAPVTPPTTAPVNPNAPTDGPGDVDAGTPVWLWLAAVVVIAGVAFVFILRRRSSRVGAAAEGPEHAWITLRERLPEPWQWSLASTPHEAAEGLSQAIDAAGPGFTPAAHDALARLANAVSDHRYAPDGTAAEVAHMYEWADLVSTEALASQRDEAKNLPVRAGGQTAPRRDA